MEERMRLKQDAIGVQKWEIFILEFFSKILKNTTRAAFMAAIDRLLIPHNINIPLITFAVCAHILVLFECINSWKPYANENITLQINYDLINKFCSKKEKRLPILSVSRFFPFDRHRWQTH